MLINPEKFFDMQMRDNALENVQIFLRLGMNDDAKEAGELSRNLADRIKNHDYSEEAASWKRVNDPKFDWEEYHKKKTVDNAPLPTTKDVE